MDYFQVLLRDRKAHVVKRIGQSQDYTMASGT